MFTNVSHSILAAAPTAFFFFFFPFLSRLLSIVCPCPRPPPPWLKWVHTNISSGVPRSGLQFIIGVTDTIQCRFILQNICHYRIIQMVLQGDRIEKKKRTKIKDTWLLLAVSFQSPFCFIQYSLRFLWIYPLLWTVTLMSDPILCVWWVILLPHRDFALLISFMFLYLKVYFILQVVIYK